MEYPFSLGAETPSAVVQKAIEVTSPSTQSPAAGDGVWMPVDMPSMGLADYPAQLRVRKFTIPDLARLGAARKLNSYPMVVAAIGDTIQGVEVKMLTHGDFDYLINWHAVNSIVKAPLVVKWRSRYGFDNKTTVTDATRKPIYIEDFTGVNEFKAKGYDFSRVGDELWRLHMTDLGLFSKTEEQAEHERTRLNAGGVRKSIMDGISGAELETYFGLATWMRVEDPLSFESKLTKAMEMTDLSFYEELDEWRTVANHGVNTIVRLTCEHFVAADAIGNLQQSLAMLDALAANGDFDEFSANQVESMLRELANLRKLDAAGRLSEATPVEEEIKIPLDVTNFFPVVL